MMNFINFFEFIKWILNIIGMISEYIFIEVEVIKRNDKFEKIWFQNEIFEDKKIELLIDD
jgi:hypothetical protein